MASSLSYTDNIDIFGEGIESSECQNFLLILLFAMFKGK